MNIKRFFQRLFRLNNQKTSLPSGAMQAGKSEAMQKVLTMLANTQDVELTCDDVFALLDQFAELAAQGEDVAQLMPMVQQHLDMCDDCREEYKVLESILHGAA
jgi:predicted component of type VI protein secretion system